MVALEGKGVVDAPALMKPYGKADSTMSLVEMAVEEDTGTSKLAAILSNFLVLVALFFLSGFGLYTMFKNLPGLSLDKRQEIWQILPKNFTERGKLLEAENLRALFYILESYRSTHYWPLAIMLSCIYLFYQSFPLFLMWFPGTATALTILFGALYGLKVGMIFCCTLATVGPILAFMLFKYAGKPLLLRLFRGRLREFRSKLFSHANNKWELISYIIFLRVTPIFPNFFISIASPVLNVPLWAFALGTFIGLVPNTFVLISLGTSLGSLSLSTGTWKLYIILIGIVSVPLVRKYFLKFLANQSHRQN